MPHLSFHPGFGGGAALLLAAGSLSLAALGYRRAYASVRSGSWWQLFLLRAAAIMVVLLLLFRPVLTFPHQLGRPRSIVFLVDNSASMSISDDAGGGTRYEHAVNRIRQWKEEIEGEFQMRFAVFAETGSRVDQLQQLAQQAPEGKATSLSRGLAVAARAAPAADIEAILMLSDGIHNARGNPAEDARKLGVPIYTVGVGSSLRGQTAFRDVQVSELDCPDSMALENRTRVQGQIEAIGFPGRVVQVELLEDEKSIATQPLVLDDLPGPQNVTFEFVPATRGLHRYQVALAASADERISENNAKSKSVLVVDPRIRVLYLEGTLRPEYGALVGQFLAKDPDVEFAALVQTRPNVFVLRSNIPELQLDRIPEDVEFFGSIDVFVIGDLDSSYLSQSQMRSIGGRVAQGAGLLMLGGYHGLGPGGYADTPLAEILPVSLGSREVGQLDSPFLPMLTPDGQQHPIFANITAFFPTRNLPPRVAGLPPLEGCVRLPAPGPAATVLASHPEEESGGVPMPVMVVQRVQQGRSAVFAGDTTRNWHQVLRTMDRETPFLRFWGQSIRWLAGREGDFATEAAVIATSDKAYYEPESPILIRAVVRGNEGTAAADVPVSARITGPGGQVPSITLAAVPGPAGNYAAEFIAPSTGRYEIEVRAELADKTLTAEQLVVDVGRPNLEFDRLDLNEDLLTQIADTSGGSYWHLTTADRLIERLRRVQRREVIRYELPLHQPLPLWALFAALLTGEWVLRRRLTLR